MSDAAYTANNNKTTRAGPFGKSTDIAMAISVVGILFVLIIPLPTLLLDALMALNLMLSILVILTVLYTQKVTDFSLFPTVMLVLTVFGLVLNISSTRLILTQGAQFDGRMIRAFSSFVVGSDNVADGLVVGAVIFVALIVMQVVVITKGATRTSEVAARFTLDAMPNKYMAIDSEYSSGVITEEEARRRKGEVQQEADFYGSMDGASKFISGSVKFGIFMTVLNILGGIIIGTVIHGEPIVSAVNDYLRFSIGDGLLSQFPTLLISTAMGILVTRAATPGDLGVEVAIQFTRDARIYWISAFVLMGLAFLPGFPHAILFVMAAFFGFYAYTITMKQRKKGVLDAAAAQATQKPREDPSEMPPIVPLEALSLEIGYGLIPFVDKDKGAELLDRVQGVRRQSAIELGLVIPKIRIIDSMMLEPSEYCFKIRGVDVGTGIIRINYYLCINSGNVRGELYGEKTRDPAFGLPAVWISDEKRDEAERLGYTVVDPPTIISTHLTEIIKRNAAEILGRQETQAIIETLKKDYPALVEEAAGQRGLSLGEIQKVLQNLLKEQISIRNMVSILETLADFAPLTHDTRFLTEKVRQKLSRQISHKYADENKILHVLTLDMSLEQKIIDSRMETNSGVLSALEPSVHRAWIKALSRAISAIAEHGYVPPIIVCSEQARYLVKLSTERESFMSELVVLSIQEIASDITLEYLGAVKLD
ncbi:MAG: flagellar biosynthesis protein FlhA [Treponema sp.]|jgi:flagellar biosynthesis protein FlhA|nr:flagellar biosynthesis protein FlhA [Treponema sp.]